MKLGIGGELSGTSSRVPHQPNRAPDHRIEHTADQIKQQGH